MVRYGGDKFILIFDNSQAITKIEIKMEAMLDFWKKTSFKSENYNFKITFSYGAVIFTNDSKVEDIISNADNAMYRQKRSR